MLEVRQSKVLRIFFRASPGNRRDSFKKKEENPQNLPRNHSAVRRNCSRRSRILGFSKSFPKQRLIRYFVNNSIEVYQKKIQKYASNPPRGFENLSRSSQEDRRKISINSPRHSPEYHYRFPKSTLKNFSK